VSEPIPPWPPAAAERVAAEAGDESAAALCLYCKVPLDNLGEHEIRTGGTSAAAMLFFGQLAEVGEEKLPLELFACPRCRTAVFRVPGR
jgi:hypothetical protein